MNTKAVGSLFILAVVLCVVLYAVLVVSTTWPISELSLEKAGEFGDSFGVLTSLFSGLAFSGALIAILLQREELQLQRQELAENRKEFAKSATAQERGAQLSALSALLNECEAQLKEAKEALESQPLYVKNPELKHLLQDEDSLRKQAHSLQMRKARIMHSIVDILERTGVALEVQVER